MRLGGPIFDDVSDPEKWVAAVRRSGYRAAYCPVDSPDERARDYVRAAKEADVVIAEVGVWNNPIDPDETKRRAAVARCIDRLALAEDVGAACCVNIAGSRHPTIWYAAHPDNLTDETLDRIVASVREIVDSVKPARTFYTLETMPWSYPDSAESYERLIRAIDRKAFAVHFDPVNLLNSPEKFFNSGRVIRDFVARLAPHIRSCHLKDLAIREDIVSVQFDEVRPGLGRLDYATLLT